MFGWLFDGQVKAMARVIHEMCSLAHHAHTSLGTPLARYFELHPLKRNHNRPGPNDRDAVHQFWLSDGKNEFAIMVCEGSKPWVSVSPQGDFAWAHVQATANGRYIVQLERSLSKPQGPMAAKLLREFERQYGALNVSV